MFLVCIFHSPYLLLANTAWAGPSHTQMTLFCISAPFCFSCCLEDLLNWWSKSVLFGILLSMSLNQSWFDLK